MITIKLAGGLGNQMFQYAIAKSLADKYNTKILFDMILLKNRSFLIYHVDRNYELGVFGIFEEETLISKIITKMNFFNKIIHPYLFELINKIYYGKNFIKEKDGKYIDFKNYNDNIYLDGAWNSYKYFEEIEKNIKNIFEVKKGISENAQNILNIILKNFKNSISIHIRRGDYITNKQANSWHGVCSNEYYYNAIKYIKEKIDNPYIFIFSDEIEWVKNNMDFGNENIFHVENNKGYEDLKLMYNCGNHIIANSTFSWWGAYLGKNENKIVIAPKKWLNKEKFDTSNILPPNWIKI